jgi:hypothetical protein
MNGTTEIRAELLIRKFARGAANHGVTLMNAELTIGELELLITLAADQLFRREFIDPKMPGHKNNPGEISLGKTLLGRLRSLTDFTRKETSYEQDPAERQNGSRKGIAKTDAV